MSEATGAEATNADAAAAAAATQQQAAATQHQGQQTDNGGGSTDDGQTVDYATLSDDEATREWLQKHELKDAKALAAKAYNLDKLVGGAVKVPGKDATDEERAAFFNKLGRPEAADKYDFTVPEGLPENVPYDAEAANEYREAAHAAGLTQQQAATLHDWFVQQQVRGVEQIGQQSTAQLEQKAVEERTKLEKVWGPVNSETGKQNAALADRALSAAPATFIADLQAAGMLGPRKEVLNANLGIFLSSVGAAVYKEDGVLKGNPDAMGNPFADGATNNLTNAMRLVKSDPDQALTLIYAAGKDPADFGLKRT